VMGLPPAFPNQRGEIIGKSPTEPYVPAPRPEWLSHPKGPTVPEIWPGLYDRMVKDSEEKGQASKNSLQGEAQETSNGETSSGQAKPDKHESRKLLSSDEEKIATMRASIDKLKENPELLQSFTKRLNDKKVRERSLLESNPENVRRLLQDEPSAQGYTYTLLTPTGAQDQLQYSQAFQEAIMSSSWVKPGWNYTFYAYQSNSATEKGIIAIYPLEGNNVLNGVSFLVVDDPSAGNDTIGLLAQWGYGYFGGYRDSDCIEWFTPQGQFITAICHYNGDGNNTWMPNIVRFVEYNGNNVPPYLVMEYACHGTLRNAPPKSLKQVAEYVDQIANALDYLHNCPHEIEKGQGKARPLMHLDLKPENILLGEGPDGKEKILLADLGLAQEVHNPGSQPPYWAGTPAYMSPEVDRYRKPRPESDQYALAIMVYEWLSGGQRPRPNPKPLSGISDGINKVILKALDNDPSRRFKGVRAFAKAFRDVYVKYEVELDIQIDKHYEAGEEHLKARRYEEARKDFDRVLDLDGNHSAARAYRGRAHLELKQFKRALADFKRALALGYSQSWILDQMRQYFERMCQK
jgi:hypothetical protein